MRVAIEKPDRIHLLDKANEAFYGCNQEWYKTPWQRMAGCGPSVASNILLYHYRAGRIDLPIDVSDVDGYINLMETVWQYVTPTSHGLYLLSQFCDGVNCILDKIGSTLQCDALNIPENVADRPDISMVLRFIEKGLKQDAPIAFLNLCNGTVKNLDEWHWVTVIALIIDENTNTAFFEVYDNSQSISINFTEWYQTTTRGGGFVYFS